MEIKEIIGAMQAAVFMQRDRDSVPDWMEVRGLTITAISPNFIEADLVWRDARGELIWGGIEMRPLPRKMVFLESSWEIGFENLIKQLVRNYELTWTLESKCYLAQGANFIKTERWENPGKE